MNPLLQGRCITVVGAGTQPSRDPDAPVGNGRAIAIRAAREGASVVCVDRDEGAVEETWRLITEEGGTAAIVVADVTTDEGCRLAVRDEPGLVPDGIVLNVGTGFGMGVAGTSADEWDKTFALNLRAHFMLVRRARWSSCPTMRPSCSWARWPGCARAVASRPTTRRKRASLG